MFRHRRYDSRLLGMKFKKVHWMGVGAPSAYLERFRTEHDAVDHMLSSNPFSHGFFSLSRPFCVSNLVVVTARHCSGFWGRFDIWKWRCPPVSIALTDFWGFFIGKLFSLQRPSSLTLEDLQNSFRDSLVFAAHCCWPPYLLPMRDIKSRTMARCGSAPLKAWRKLWEVLH